MESTPINSTASPNVTNTVFINKNSKNDIEIDMRQMYKNMKCVLNFESKKIKKLMLYNYLNDEINSIFYDTVGKDNFDELDKVINSSPPSRLLLLLPPNASLLSPSLLRLRETIKKNHEKILSLHHIFLSDFADFTAEFPFFKDKISQNHIRLPLCVLSKILFLGNFVNGKNKKNLEMLHVRSVVSLMAERDKELDAAFGDKYRNFRFVEKNHDEIEFGEVSEWMMEAVNNNDTPILIYDFVGKGVSSSACAAFLMDYKKWPMELCIGYMMKLSSQINNIQPFLYMQLQRYEEKRKKNNVK